MSRRSDLKPIGERTGRPGAAEKEAAARAEHARERSPATEEAADYDALIRRAMERYPKIRARLAE
ncbi:hypothetical protein [Salinarimonas rosea]|uniref:hypothetical protein n=1 Tax=Salinarimonas rosea TaxID=552063 RepID=UPI0004234AE7|nr:hypothetical protein [Salinarimonas rosea]